MNEDMRSSGITYVEHGPPVNKFDIAMYLVNLNTLLAAQSASVHNPSEVLAAEYEKHWGLLKEAITKETEDEARTERLKLQSKERNDHARSQREGGSQDRDSGSGSTDAAVSHDRLPGT